MNDSMKQIAEVGVDDHGDESMGDVLEVQARISPTTSRR
jgi:hypothetical protein